MGEKYIDIIYKNKRGKLVFFDPLTYIGLVLSGNESITLAANKMKEVTVCLNGKRITLEELFKKESTNPKWYDGDKKRQVIHIFPVLWYKKE